MANKDAQIDFVAKTIEARDVHFIRLWFTDALGNMKSFSLVPGEVERAMSDGMSFDGALIEGFARDDTPDLLAFPDPSTFQILPWRPQSNAVARMFCDIKTMDGRPFAGDPRFTLSRTLDRVHDIGYSVLVGPKIEYFYFKEPGTTTLLDEGSYFDLTSLDNASDLRRDTVLTLESMGIPVEYSHHELAPSQNEVDLRSSDATSQADAVMTYKMVVKEIAESHGVFASFMPKPMTEHPGSSMHLYISLLDQDDKNIFSSPDDKSGYGLSPIAKGFAAGILKYAPDFCLVTNQYVNSYKRFAYAPTAPVWLSCSRKRRNTIIRVPSLRPNYEESTRIEIKHPDSAANPYLLISAVLASGMAGVEEGLTLDLNDEGDLVYPEICQGPNGIPRLPSTLGEAIEAFEGSGIARETLGEHTYSYLLSSKRAEWEDYLKYVSDFERERLLKFL